MSRVLTLSLRELRSQFVSPVGWVLGSAFLLLAGYFFFMLVMEFTRLLSNYTMYAQITQNPALLEQVSLNEFVVTGLFANLLVLFLFLVPALTMRCFAEERRQGTDELLLTAPVTPGQIVTGKYLGLLTLGIGLLAASGLYLGLLLHYGDPEAGPIFTGLLGLALAMAAMIALGMAVSAATENQVVAGFGSFVLFLLLFLVDWPADSVGGWLGEFLEGISLRHRFEGFARGLVASPDVIYFLSLAALGWWTARAILASSRFR
jgi:ABC-2 type transport system permease protein